MFCIFENRDCRFSAISEHYKKLWATNNDIVHIIREFRIRVNGAVTSFPENRLIDHSFQKSSLINLSEQK